MLYLSLQHRAKPGLTKEDRIVFRKFMEEVAVIELAGEFKDPALQEVAEGEEVVGRITDPYLMALCTATENRARAFEDKIPQMTEDEVRRVDEEFHVIKEIMWAELRLHFGVFSGTVGSRKGWTVVRTKEKQPMPELQILAIPLDELLGLDPLLDLPDCGDPNCPIHGIDMGSRGRRRKPRA